MDYLQDQIRQGLIQKVSFKPRNGADVYKYIHKQGEPGQTRIYVVANVKTGRLISVEKPSWRKQKTNRKPRQRPAGSKRGRTSKKSPKKIWH